MFNNENKVVPRKNSPLCLQAAFFLIKFKEGLNEKISLLLIISSIVVLSTGCLGESEVNTQFTIGIIQYNDHIALDQARLDLLMPAKDNGYQDNDKISLDYQNAQIKVI